jgi:hypothetical protein
MSRRVDRKVLIFFAELSRKKEKQGHRKSKCDGMLERDFRRPAGDLELPLNIAEEDGGSFRDANKWHGM